MAQKAGRNGLKRKFVDAVGNLISSVPVATATKLGGIKVGDGLSATTAGKLNIKTPVPAPEAGDVGKVLTATSDGLEWQSGGGAGGVVYDYRTDSSDFTTIDGSYNSDGEFTDQYVSYVFDLNKITNTTIFASITADAPEGFPYPMTNSVSIAIVDEIPEVGDTADIFIAKNMYKDGGITTQTNGLTRYIVFSDTGGVPANVFSQYFNMKVIGV